MGFVLLYWFFTNWLQQSRYNLPFFNSALNVTQKHYTDNGLTTVIANWHCSDFPFLFPGWNYWPIVSDSDLKSWDSQKDASFLFRRTAQRVHLWDVCWPLAKPHCAWQTGHAVALTMQSELPRSQPGWSHCSKQASGVPFPKWLNIPPSPWVICKNSHIGKRWGKQGTSKSFRSVPMLRTWHLTSVCRELPHQYRAKLLVLSRMAYLKHHVLCCDRKVKPDYFL